MTQPPTDNESGRADGHYFDASPASREELVAYTIDVDGRSLALHGAAGVFSSRGLDKATAVLLEWASHHADEPPPGSHLLDLGCGAGPMALTLAARHRDCTVHAIDVNERARKVCADNARANGLDNVVVSSPDDVDPSLRFAVIWSNPPIRVGKQALHDMLATWLARLDAEGHALLVVSKNLGADSLSQWLASGGHPVEKMASKKGFRVLRASPRPAVDQ